MAESRERDEEISVLALGATFIRARWRIIRWMALGAIIAVFPILFNPPLSLGSASFAVQAADASRTGLASLAGQLGVSLGQGNQAQSPDFFAALLKSPELLSGIARDSFVVQEMNGRTMAFLDLFTVEGGTAKEREERGVDLLTKMVTASVDRVTARDPPRTRPAAAHAKGITPQNV